jgi:uncharacterized protein (DUF488 family)
MFYRKKILLNLLHTFGGKLEKISFMKLLFLFCNSDKTRQYYEFVPYKHGAFSFTSYSDINGLEKDGVIYKEKKFFILKQFDKQLFKITEYDNKRINAFRKSYYDKTSKDFLMKITYEHYPYYAKNSTRTEFMTPKIKEAIGKEIIADDGRMVLFDIGYEGKSLEGYLNLLIRSNIKILVDVRKNPISMKYGFSKDILSKRAIELGIKYMHIHELGVESNKRKSLSSFEDYQNLFADYESKTLPQNVKSVEKVYDILKQNNRIALTCFEADKNYCHRYRVVKLMNALYPNKFEMRHL